MAKIGGLERLQVGTLDVPADKDAAVTYTFSRPTRESKMTHQGHLAGFKETPRPGRLTATGLGLTAAQMRQLMDDTNVTVTAVGNPTVTLRNAFLVEDKEVDMIEGTLPLTWEGAELVVF